MLHKTSKSKVKNRKIQLWRAELGCFDYHISPRKAFLAWPPSPPWNLSFFTVESTLFSPCFRSDSSLSLAKMWLSLTLTLSHLTIWCSGQTVLFLLFLAIAALAYLPTALSMALRPLYFFSRPSMLKFFHCTLRHSASFPLVSAAPTSLPLLLSPYLTLALSLSLCLFLRLSFYLNLFGRSGRNCFLSSPVLSGYNGSSDTRFSRGTTRLMSLSDGLPSATPCSLSSLIYRIHFFLFSD